MFHLIRNVSYLCFVCTVAVCLFVLVERCDRDQGGGVVSVTLELFPSSLPSAISLSPSCKMEEFLLKPHPILLERWPLHHTQMVLCVLFMCVCCVLEELDSLCVLPGSQHVIVLGKPSWWKSVLPEVSYLLPEPDAKVEEKLKNRKNKN